MKKSLPLIAIAILSMFVAPAQEKVVTPGVKGGANFSWLTNFPGNGARPGFHLGGLLHLRLNARWRLQPEVYFSTQGERYDPKDPEEYYNYLAFPLLLQYRFKHGFFVEAGPQLGILVNGRMREYGSPSYTGHHENTFDFLIPVGAGYQISRRLGVYAR